MKTSNKYNKEIQKAEADILSGKVYSQKEALDKIQEWKKRIQTK